MSNYSKSNREVYGKMTLARCPKCQEHHHVRLNWIGNGTPRIFCDACRRVAYDRSSGFDNDSQFNTKEEL